MFTGLHIQKAYHSVHLILEFVMVQDNDFIQIWFTPLAQKYLNTYTLFGYVSLCLRL